VSFFDINNIAFTAINYPMSWVELIATIAGLLAVWLSAREHIANWGIGLINIVFSFFIFYQMRLYSDMFLQIYFFATGVLGWWQWARLKKKNDTPSVENKEKLLKISYLTKSQQIWMTGAIIVLTAVVGSMITRLHEWFPVVFPQPAAFPYADTLVMMMSIFGNFLLTIKKIESWILWVLVDLIAPVLYFQKGIYLITLEYVIFLALATFALINWLKIYKKQGQTTPSVV
jgi:nicotinamide mononucleotide transporter